MNLEQLLPKLNNGEPWGAKKKAAALLGVSRNTVTEWCRNPAVEIKEEHEKRLADLLQMSVKELREIRQNAKNFDNRNSNVVTFSSSVKSHIAVSYIPVYARVTGEPFIVNFQSPTLAEETLPIIQPAAGTYAGFQVTNNDFASWNVKPGEYILVDLTQKSFQHDKRLLVEINGLQDFRLCRRSGEQVELIHANPSKYPTVHINIDDLQVLGVCKRKIQVEDF